MKRMILSFAVVAAAAAALMVPTPAACLSGSCGIEPIKPIVPIGCRDLKAVCNCDSRGQNCRWQWQCVK